MKQKQSLGIFGYMKLLCYIFKKVFDVYGTGLKALNLRLNHILLADASFYFGLKLQVNVKKNVSFTINI